MPPGPEWLRAQWERANLVAGQQAAEDAPVLLILDEIQKVRGWSEVVKELWDIECIQPRGLEVLLLGSSSSSSLLLQKGLSESLAGRFFLHRCPHWRYTEMYRAFYWNLDQWIYFGGYPGAAGMIEDEYIWAKYVIDLLIETVYKDPNSVTVDSYPAAIPRPKINNRTLTTPL